MKLNLRVFAVGLFLFALGVTFGTLLRPNNRAISLPITSSPSISLRPIPTENVSGKIYQNQYFKITVPSDWTVSSATQTTYISQCRSKSDCTMTKQAIENPAAANLTKGKYILYINGSTQQASGVIGGRFAEVAMGAPSADAVVTQEPSECGERVMTNDLVNGYPRVDFYVGPKDKTLVCQAPSDKTVWFFSVITDKRGGFFNYDLKRTDMTGYVITMAYNSKNVNDLPVKGSPELNSMLDEMTSILKTLQFKK